MRRASCDVGRSSLDLERVRGVVGRIVVSWEVVVGLISLEKDA